MKQAKLKQFIATLSYYYQVIEDYFTKGSFGVKFYPLLMHPCIRASRKSMIQLIAVFAIFCGLYYLFGELITILFSKFSLVATYSQHSTLELLQSAGTIIDGQEIFLSPLFLVMKTAWLMQAILFFLIYLLGISHISQRVGIITFLFTLIFACGAMLIQSSQGGRLAEDGLHNLGVSLTLLCGNFAIILIGFGLNSSATSAKYYSFIAGFIGCCAIGATLALDLPLFALLERVGIYSIIIWQIIIGFAILKQVK